VTLHNYEITTKSIIYVKTLINMLQYRQSKRLYLIYVLAYCDFLRRKYNNISQTNVKFEELYFSIFSNCFLTSTHICHALHPYSFTSGYNLALLKIKYKKIVEFYDLFHYNAQQCMVINYWYYFIQGASRASYCSEKKDRYSYKNSIEIL